MALPSIVTTTDTFQVWFDATNNLISHVANSNYYLIAGQTLTGTATVNGAVTLKSLTVSNSAVFGTTGTDTAVFNSTVTMTQPLTLTSQLSTTNVVATGSGDFGTTLRVAANAAFDTNVLFVDATNNRVGLGNTIPAHVLRVEGTTSLNGAVNALSTLSVSGAVNALGALGVTGALTALSTLSVSGAVNALGAFGVSGAANALNTFGVSGAANALGTLGVSGTLTALGQMAVTANANFNSGTLFVDAVNNRVGVGTTSPTTAVDVNGTVTATTFSGSFSGSGASITSLNATNISSGSLNLARLGTVSGGRIIMGNTSNQAEALSITGDVTISSGGVTSIASNVIVNADINTGAAIAYSKLSLSNSIVNADINTGAAIAISKLAASTISGVSLGNNLNNVTFNNGGAGAVSGSTYNGSSAITVSYNTVGAPSTSGTNASGTWNINILGTAYGKSEGNLNANSATYASQVAAGTRFTLNRYTPFASSGGSILFKESFYQVDKWVAESYNGGNPANEVFRIFSTGGSANTVAYIPEIGGTAWIFVSDERTKELFGPIENPKEKLTQLRTVYGKFKGDDTNRQQAFLVAQDVQKVLPEAVYVSNDKGFDDLLSLNHNQVLVLAIAAIKELIADNEELRTRIHALETA